MKKFIKIFIGSLCCFHSLVVADFEKIAEDLKPYSSKISMENVNAILDQDCSLKNKEAFKQTVNDSVLTESSYALASVSFVLYTGRIGTSGEDFGAEIFNHSENSYLVRFLLASIVILNREQYESQEKLQCALDTLVGSILDGQEAIIAYLGKDSERNLLDILEETKDEYSF